MLPLNNHRNVNDSNPWLNYFAPALEWILAMPRRLAGVVAPRLTWICAGF
jgi:hypothetical protein